MKALWNAWEGACVVLIIPGAWMIWELAKEYPAVRPFAVGLLIYAVGVIAYHAIRGYVETGRWFG